MKKIFFPILFFVIFILSASCHAAEKDQKISGVTSYKVVYSCKQTGISRETRLMSLVLAERCKENLLRSGLAEKAKVVCEGSFQKP